MSSSARPKNEKRRLDQLVVERGLADSREKAQALILAGKVLVDRQKSDKPGRAIDMTSSVELLEKMPYVSRGGFKLAAALDHWKIAVTGMSCIDVGASTGGFTDVLLQRGAAQVCAVDVGHGQLDWKLRNDPRVVVKEGINVRILSPRDWAPRYGLAVCDVSFISATLMIPFLSVVAPKLIVLVKPQFEVGRDQVGKGGIVRETQLQRAACARVRAAVEALGFKTDIIESPILGAEGNREFLLYAQR
jgi:23S rRNA (cytidine1920-2'-O)/16S rRNA (cytidine1409-2'-O)-methyltransferase